MTSTIASVPAPASTGTDPDTAPAGYSSRRAWLITGALALFMVINWGDKSVLGLTSHALMDDLGLTPSQYGLIASAFFFLFGVSTVVGGMLVDRIQTRWMLIAMALVWAVVQFPVMGAASFSVLLISRVVLGLAEGPASPVSLHAVMKWFPDEKRDVPNAIVLGSSSLGVLIAAPAMAFVQVHWGWRWCFGVLGIAGLVWVALWLMIGKEGPYDVKPAGTPAATDDAEPDESRVPYRNLFASPTWAFLAFAGFACYFVTAILTTWLPTYLESVRGISTVSTGNLIAAVAATGAVAMFGQGWVSRRLLARGVSSRWSRSGVPAVAIVIAAVAMFAFAGTGGTVQLILMLPAFILYTTIFPAATAAVAEITPVAQRGTALGVFFAFFGVAGMLAPAIAGRLIENASTEAGGYHVLFLICGALLLAAGVAVLLLVDPERDRRRLQTKAAS
ncbi:MFS transporter [Gordonia neofelifaecis]|uniref:Major facilitator superfamily MFS_1 n=1 Tax=Gordonia neofelifaecis NRRL B-59395 TaxID=644548 RepID=F1YPA0_9ACTN|nr:MFS transporter [Gordonia neofelifaecis]EGD53495.1 major facilitator superfamily MFS_1 [Gordonia neofelifaecis NRRL B-59395]